VTRHHSCRVSPFGHPRIHARLTTPRGISQPPTSFIGSQCQGIHHAPLHTYNTKPKMSHPHTPTGACRISKLHINTHRNPPPPRAVTTMRARCSQPLSTNQTPHPTTKARRQQPNFRVGSRPSTSGQPTSGFPHSGRRGDGPVVSKPNSVSGNPSPQNPTEAESRCGSTFVVHQTRRHYSTRVPHGSHPHQLGMSLVVLLRKEVIQPHLPVRLPCYDFVPIADPTFDGSLPHGVRPPASGVTDFHDVTGGVYKARERIHRSVADLRLLATPTSRGRVADPDPN
jgi:hypothetical protein